MSPEAELFVRFDYTETRDLMKTFITIVSATLVFSISFSEKITRTHEADDAIRRTMFFAWAFFFAAIVAGGGAIVLIAAGASCVVYGAAPFLPCAGPNPAILSWISALAGGSLYVFGLFLLAFAARRAILLERRAGRPAATQSAPGRQTGDAP